MGIVWVPLTIKGSLLGVPENATDVRCTARYQKNSKNIRCIWIVWEVNV